MAVINLIGCWSKMAVHVKHSKTQLNLGRLRIEVVSEEKWKKQLILALEVPEEKKMFKIQPLRCILTTTRRFGFSKERTTGWDAWRQQSVLGLTMTQRRTCSKAVTKMGKHHKDHIGCIHIVTVFLPYWHAFKTACIFAPESLHQESNFNLTTIGCIDWYRIN